ncbi:MAG: 4-(cytidine 5'-diphospho)-2-C-methyl-D-erythritol kinase [Lachnospiraceae bacterium]|nr:4-(cytidine 5'-diphospho)-2-C-methyl-D-erythritol kinase [Lachnospiraceae bacterium]
MNTKAYAKINLCLDVKGRRNDGYHEVSMVMQQLMLADDISVEKRDDERIVLTMEPAVEGIPTDGRNLMVKAAELFREKQRISQGVTMRLVKRIPSEAGLAGGSADAAAVLKGMNDLFGTGLGTDELSSLGARIGADVPFCILGGTALAEGIGEILTPLHIPEEAALPYVLLAKPGVGVSTPVMYRALDDHPDLPHPDTLGYVRTLTAEGVRAAARYTGNIFEEVVIPEIPVIRSIKEDMMSAGAYAACMSGSGPTVFGLFESRDVMRAAAERIRGASYAGELAGVFVTTFR